MELPYGFKQEIVILFDQRDLGNLVKEVWGKTYDTGNALDCPHNGSHYEYDISDIYEGDYLIDEGKLPWYENAPDEENPWFNLERVVERLEHPGLGPGPEDVLTALVEIGKLPAGKYILDYWW